MARDKHGLALVPASLSAERRALAHAIDARTAAEAVHAEALAADSAAASALSAAQRAVNAATAAIEAARGEAAAAALAAARGGVAPPTAPARAARAALLDAEDSLAAAAAARDTLAVDLAEASRVLARAGGAVTNAVAAVVTAEGASLADECAASLDRIQRALVSRGALLKWLIESGAVPTHTEHGQGFKEPIDESVRLIMSRLHSPSHYWRALEPERAGAAAALIEAATALAMDASAPLPALPPVRL